jgi:hypothetical protein
MMLVQWFYVFAGGKTSYNGAGTIDVDKLKSFRYLLWMDISSSSLRQY